MSKDQRIVVTRESVQKELLNAYRREKRFLPLSLIVLVLISAFFIWLTVLAAQDEASYLVVMAVIDLFYFTYLAANACHIVFTFRLMKRGDFRIVTDKLVGMAESERNPERNPFLSRYADKYEDAFYFAENGRVPLRSDMFSYPTPEEMQGRSMLERGMMVREYVAKPYEMFEYSSCGDEFILVILNNRREDVVRAYNMKMYRLDDLHAEELDG